MNPVIFGCPRSGTSIFGELFKTVCPAYRFEPRIEELEEVPVTEGEAMKLPVGPPPRPEGLAVNLGSLDRLVPHVVPVWIVRNPLDTVCSLRLQMKPEVALTSNHHPPSLPGSAWVHTYNDPLVTAAIFWNWLNGIGYFNLCKHYGEEIPFVKFEDMTAFPREFSNMICDRLRLDSTKVDPWVAKVSNNKGGYEAKIQEIWNRKSNTVRTGRWRENLSMDEARLVRATCFDTARRFGYNLEEIERND